MRHIVPSKANSYTGGRLDRAAHRRTDEAWLATALTHPDSRFTLFWRGEALIAGDAPPAAALVPPPGYDAPWVFLGLQDNVAIFAQDLSALETPPSGLPGKFTNLRSLTALLEPDDATILATARGMLHWRAVTKFCAACGPPTCRSAAATCCTAPAAARNIFRAATPP